MPGIKKDVKFLLFLTVAFAFLYLSGIHIVPGKNGHILDWQIRIGGAITFPLLFIVKSALAILIGFWLATRMVSFCERNIKHFKQITPTNQSILINIIQIFIYFIFFVAVLDILDFPSNSITFISSAAALGLSFGLRQIVSNLVSGFILLLDRSVNVGDFVETKDQLVGFVRRIGTLYTHIEITDGREIFIPNAEIFNHLAANWTLNNRQARVEFEIIIDYMTDINVVREICYTVMNAHPCRSEHHEPSFFVDRCGDLGLVLKMHFWLDDIYLGRNRVKSELLTEIYTELQKRNITLPSYAQTLSLKNRQAQSQHVRSKSNLLPQRDE